MLVTFVNSLGYRRVRRTTLIAVGCASFLAGVGVSQLSGGLGGWFWLVVVASLVSLCLKKKLVVALPAVVLIGLVLGLWRGGAMLDSLKTYQSYLGQKVGLVGTVVEDPTYDDKGQLDFRLQSVTLDGQSLPGQVRIKTFSPVDSKRGDKVFASGKLVDGFGNYQAAVYFADVETLAVDQNFIDTLRRQFAASVLSTVPEPQASLGLGF